MSCESVVLFLYLRIALYAVVGMGSLLLAALSLEYRSWSGAGMNGLFAILFFMLGGFLLFSECSHFETREVWTARGVLLTTIVVCIIPFQWTFLSHRAKGRRK